MAETAPRKAVSRLMGLPRVRGAGGGAAEAVMRCELRALGYPATVDGRMWMAVASGDDGWMHRIARDQSDTIDPVHDGRSCRGGG